MKLQIQSVQHKKLGDKIKTLRSELNYSQEKLADLVQVDRSYMGFVERGEKNPTMKTLIKIAKALQVNLSELFDNI